MIIKHIDMSFPSIVSPDKYRWDSYVENHSSGWFWHTTMWINYCLEYNSKSINHSFYVLDTFENIIGVCPLIQNGNSFSMGCDPCAIPLFENPLVLKKIIQEVENIANTNNIENIRFRDSPLSESILEIPTYKDISWTSQVINLDKSSDELWSGVSKGHRSDIHSGLREYDIINSQITDWDGELIIDEFHHLHKKTTGRETRPDKTWDLMREWIGGNFINVFFASRNDFLMGGLMFLEYKDSVYYMSSACPEKGVSHALMWSALRYYSDKKFDEIEIGWLNTGSLAVFKSGFGGDAKVVHVMEKTGRS